MQTSRSDSWLETYEDSGSPSESSEEEEEETKDASGTLESEGHSENPKSAFLTPGRFESNPASPSKDATDGSLVAHKSSTVIPPADKQEASNRSLAGVESRIHDKYVSSEDKECSESIIDGKIIMLSSKKKALSEDTEDPKNSYLEANAARQSHLRYCGSIGLETNALFQAQRKETAKACMMGGSSIIGNPDNSLEKVVPHLHSKTELNMTDDSSLSSMLTPKRRPRSSSPGALSENLSKRPATVCAFYARGWCIRGNSCRFLHQEGSKGGLIEASGKGDILDNTGTRGEAERLRVSSSREGPDSSNTESSSKSQLQIHRALVRQYGGEGPEGPGSPHYPASPSIRAGGEFHRGDVPQVEDASSRDEYTSSFGVSPPFDPMDGRRSTNEQLLSGRYLNEGKLQLGTPKREFLNNTLFPRGSSLTTGLVGDSYASSSLYLSNNSLACDRRSADFVFRNRRSAFLLKGSHSSYSLTSTWDSSFQISGDRLNIHNPFDFDRAYHSSTSASLRRSYSHYFPRKALESSWEPSEPFQPSFHWAPASLSFLGGPYNPFHDSVVTHNTGNIALQASDRTSGLDVVATDGDTLSYGNCVAAYNVQKSSFPEPDKLILDECTPPHGLSSQTPLLAASGHTAADGGSSSLPKVDKSWIPDHVLESANANGSGNGGIDHMSQEEMARISKESKAMRIFRTVLVDFVKDLVRPSWQKGQISKEAHKIIVKKTVEKVLGALQPHEVPSTSDSINQYLSTSRPKLSKVAEGYVGKYANPKLPRF